MTAEDFAEAALKHLAPTMAELNRASLQQLAENVDNLIPFVGAGLSAPFGFPAWHLLLERLANSLGLSSEVAPLLKQHLFEEAAEHLSQNYSNYLEDMLQQTFKEKEIERPIKQGAIRFLPSISKGVVLTTNFDRMLEMVYSDHGRPFELGKVFPGTRIREATAAVQQRKHCLLKLHGDYEDSSSRILTLSDYEREYGGTSPEKINDKLRVPLVLGQALATGPFLFLGCSLKTDRTLQIIRQLAKLYPGLVHFALLSGDEAEKSRLAQLNSWNIRPLFYPSGRYSAVERVLEALAELCLGQRRNDNEFVAINGLKLYFFRRQAKIGVATLAKRVGARTTRLLDIERVNLHAKALGPDCFVRCRRSLVDRLEEALGCYGQLQAGQADDFRSDYMLFYRSYRSTQIAPDRDVRQQELKFNTKAVVFDFDGTLTMADQETTWEKIWLSLGYSINDCAKLHYDFSSGRIKHQEWCDLTTEKFQSRNFTRAKLNEVSSSIRLVPGVRDTFAALETQGIKIYILSGSIKYIIRRVMGDLIQMVEDFRANDMNFDRAGRLVAIRGTKYDFKGKATYLRKLMREGGFEPHEVLFIGNSCNDLDAIQSRARTLCVNPKSINADDKHWTYQIKRMENMQEILRFVESDSASVSVKTEIPA